MRVGIVAEGPSDVAVLRNILKGACGLDSNDTVVLRPELYEDETDLASRRRAPPSPETFSNWLVVIEECRTPAKIRESLSSAVAEQHLVVVHLDTEEAGLVGYDVVRPARDAQGFVDDFRSRVLALLVPLLGEDTAAGVRFAIAIEETDAWLIPLHDPTISESALLPHPKERLRRLLASKGEFGGLSAYDRADRRSRDLRKPKKLKVAMARNGSLAAFVASLPLPENA